GGPERRRFDQRLVPHEPRPGVDMREEPRELVVEPEVVGDNRGHGRLQRLVDVLRRQRRSEPLLRRAAPEEEDACRARVGARRAPLHEVVYPAQLVVRHRPVEPRRVGARRAEGLIQRTTRRLQLTEAGRVYYESVSRALSGMDEAAAAVSELQDAPRGRVRITAPADLGHWLLAPSLVSFATRYPEVQIEVSLTQRIVDLVHEGFDLALRIGKLADNRLVARALGLVRAGIFAAPRYLKRRGRPRSVADVADHDCVLFRSVSGRAVWELV